MQLQFEDRVGLHGIERTRELVGVTPLSDAVLSPLAVLRRSTVLPVK